MIWRRRRDSLDEAAAPDDELHRALVGGSEEAMAELYSRHGGKVYRFALRLMQDESTAEEVTQEVFLALLGQSDRFDAKRGSLSTWLCGIARRLVWKHLRARNRNLCLATEGDVDEFESTDDDPAVTLNRKQALEAVEQGLRDLPPNLREVVVLCELEEMRYEDVAAVLGVPIGTVRSRLHRAKHRLACLLAPEPARTVGTKIEERP